MIMRDADDAVPLNTNCIIFTGGALIYTRICQIIHRGLKYFFQTIVIVLHPLYKALTAVKKSNHDISHIVRDKPPIPNIWIQYMI